MREGLFLVVALLAICPLGHADEPKFSASPERESSLTAVVGRLEARINELEAQLERLKYAQQQSVIGGGLLESLEPSRPRQDPQVYFNSWGSLAAGSGVGQVDTMGVIRDARGRPVGYWGIDFAPQRMSSGPGPSR